MGAGECTESIVSAFRRKLTGETRIITWALMSRQEGARIITWTMMSQPECIRITTRALMSRQEGTRIIMQSQLRQHEDYCIELGETA